MSRPRPTTPLRPPSPGNRQNHYTSDDVVTSALQISDFSHSLATLDKNMTDLNGVHESLNELNESFGSFVYGLWIRSWCVEFQNEVPTKPRESKQEEKDKLLREIAQLKAEIAKQESRDSRPGTRDRTVSKGRVSSVRHTPMVHPSRLQPQPRAPVSRTSRVPVPTRVSVSRPVSRIPRSNTSINPPSSTQVSRVAATEEPRRMANTPTAKNRRISIRQSMSGTLGGSAVRQIPRPVKRRETKTPTNSRPPFR